MYRNNNDDYDTLHLISIGISKSTVKNSLELEYSVLINLLLSHYWGKMGIDNAILSLIGQRGV